MFEKIIIVSAALILDMIFGDPQNVWHPIRAIGALIEFLEKKLRLNLSIATERDADKRKKLVAGIILVISVIFISVGTVFLILLLAHMIHPYVRIIVETIICYQMLAMKSLKTESMKVYKALKSDDVEQARYAVSMIVGRDTDNLTEEGITKAAVETVAENTSDGVIAPMLYIFILGAYGAVFYKAVNTLDSMVGYTNDKYIFFGRAAAKLDDVMNYIPARISALLMIMATFLVRQDTKNAVKIYLRDRRNHASPNSAHTESVCAGALSIQLAGDAYYFGKLHSKPTIGDDKRCVEIEDIKRVNCMMYVASVILYLIGIGILLLII